MKALILLTLVFAGYCGAQDVSTEAVLDKETPSSSIKPSEVPITTAVPDVVISSTTPQIITTQTTTRPRLIVTTASTTVSSEPSTTIRSISRRPQPVRSDPSTTTTVRTVSRLQSRSRSFKTAETDKPDLLPIKVIKSERPQARSRINSPTVTNSSETPVKVFVSDRAAKSGKVLKTEKDAEKVAQSEGRGKIRYPAGRNLKNDQALNFKSKYEGDKYKFSYETVDGQKRAENGIFENMGTEDQNYVVKGSYSYFDNEGIEYIVTYTADNRGYRPVINVNNPNRL